jgi:hypothetical protein
MAVKRGDRVGGLLHEYHRAAESGKGGAKQHARQDE